MSPTLTVSATGIVPIYTWSLTTQPASQQTAGVGFQVVGTVKDQFGAVYLYNGSTTVAIGANPGNSTLGGTTTVTAAAGVATFPGLWLNKSGTGYTLSLSSTGAISGVTSGFNVQAASASTLTLQSGGGQNGPLGQALPLPVVAQVTDAYGNAVSGTNVTFAVATGGGSLTPGSTSTAATGLASTQWTLGAQGAQSITVSSAGLTGSPITVTAATTVVTTIVTPKFDTLFTVGRTRQLAVQGLGSTGQPVTGSWTYTSRNPAVATVSSTGLVTAVANGSTYVVATEAGGTKDSSLTVVLQRVASINVTPITRSLYQGSSFQYGAQAFDSNNVAMAAPSNLTWGSTAGTVATVNAAGLVQAAGIGVTQITATSGTVVGVANLTVLSQITRIDVTYDSAGAVAPDVFTLASFGDVRPYRAIARDTLGAAMTGISFTWTSTNPSVATIVAAPPAPAGALSVANGTTVIKASAQGMVGSATLNVLQVMRAIDLTPATLTLAAKGKFQLTARGQDARGNYMTGGTFTFASSATKNATVDAVTGLVTGLEVGVASITATSGAITSNASVITVNASAQGVISFAHDTVSVAQGSSQSVTIYLSKPSTSPITLNLSVSDGTASWTTTSVTVPANQTSVSATLNGKAGGQATIGADDSSGAYTTATAVVIVPLTQRRVRFVPDQPVAIPE